MVVVLVRCLTSQQNGVLRECLAKRMGTKSGNCYALTCVQRVGDCRLKSRLVAWSELSLVRRVLAEDFVTKVESALGE